MSELMDLTSQASFLYPSLLEASFFFPLNLLKIISEFLSLVDVIIFLKMCLMKVCCG